MKNDEVLCGRCGAHVAFRSDYAPGMVFDARCVDCRGQDEADLKRLGSVAAVLAERAALAAAERQHSDVENVYLVATRNTFVENLDVLRQWIEVAGPECSLDEMSAVMAKLTAATATASRISTAIRNRRANKRRI